mmetsp:Transcript_74490/g.177385  ORF Transcript_74490/g.177385 Transcript_74490/m.177385 type:complete len:156 (-) Transcript_74490:122-589(-)
MGCSHTSSSGAVVECCRSKGEAAVHTSADRSSERSSSRTSSCNSTSAKKPHVTITSAAKPGVKPTYDSMKPSPFSLTRPDSGDPVPPNYVTHKFYINLLNDELHLVEKHPERLVERVQLLRFQMDARVHEFTEAASSLACERAEAQQAAHLQLHL